MIQKRYSIGLLAMLMILFTACEKETTKDVSTTLKVPTIELIGNEYVSVAVGGTYTDQGATYTGEDGSVVEIQPSVNDVNTAVPGLYFITYEEESTSGIFHTEAHRVVAVSYQDNPVDYSGEYLRAATGMSAFITKLAPGFYRVQNPGGSTGGHTGVVVYFVESALNTFIGPHQPNDLVGDIEFADIHFTDTGADWRIIGNSLYATGVRTFVKQ